jgi:hypothetical protein
MSHKWEQQCRAITGFWLECKICGKQIVLVGGNVPPEYEEECPGILVDCPSLIRPGWHNPLCDICANVLCKETQKTGADSCHIHAGRDSAVRKDGITYPSVCEYVTEMPCPHATAKKEDGIIDRIWCNKTGKQCVCTFIWDEYGCPMRELMSSRYVDCPGCLDGSLVK